MYSPEEPISHSVSELAQLGQVLEQHRPRLLAMLQRRIDPRMATRWGAEDILSEVYIAARNRWSERADKSPDKAYSWLYRLARDCLISAWRREVRECRDLRNEMPWPDHSSVQLGLGLVNSGTSPSEALQREELRQAVRVALAQLSPADREILRMRHEDSLSYAEIAELEDLSENAAAVRHVRALKRLREYWSRYVPSGESGR